MKKEEGDVFINQVMGLYCNNMYIFVCRDSYKTFAQFRRLPTGTQHSVLQQAWGAGIIILYITV